MHSSTLVSGRDVDERRGHDLAHERLLFGPPLERDAPQVVALGDDPDDVAAVGDEKRADVRVDHPLDRVEDGRVRVDPEHLAPLPLQDLRDVAHGARSLTQIAGGGKPAPTFAGIRTS
jgi:hypothetical protein